MLTRRVQLKPKYELFGKLHLPEGYHTPLQSPGEIAMLAAIAYSDAIDLGTPMSYINHANTHWIAYHWRDLPREEFERILQEDGLDLDIARLRYALK